MKNKTLFILQSIGYGGSMTSLINLLGFLGKDINGEKYDVMFLDPYGELLEEAKRVAHVLQTPYLIKSAFINREKIKKMRRFDLYIVRIFIAIIARCFHRTPIELLTEFASSYFKKYDTIIAYQESSATNFVAEIKCPRKITWLHNDYSNVVKLYASKDEFLNVYTKFDLIVCVSAAGARNFIKYTSISRSKIHYIYNTLDSDLLRQKAEVSVHSLKLKDDDKVICTNFINFGGLKFVSSGRFTNQKRFDRVVTVSKKLKDTGVDFKWIILGDGPLRSHIIKAINDNDLQDFVFSIGAVNNPFAIVSRADFFVLTSDFEAHPMVANEALILHTPVITTNFESAPEVVSNGENGLICDMSDEGIYESVYAIYHNDSLRKRLKDGANNFVYSNSAIVDSVKKLIYTKNE